MRISFLTSICLVGLTCAACASDAAVPTATVKADYDVGTHYDQGTLLAYPDFTVQFVGKTKKRSEYSDGPLDYYEFRFSTEKSSHAESFTNGMGMADPHGFEIDGVKFYLSIYAENEIVISTTPDL